MSDRHLSPNGAVAEARERLRSLATSGRTGTPSITLRGPVNVAVFGGFRNRMLAPGWTNSTVLALLGGGAFDLTGVVPGEQARLTAVAILGGVKITVDQGSQVTMSGLSLFGGRQVTVEPGDGPRITVRAVAVFGGVEVGPPDST